MMLQPLSLGCQVSVQVCLCKYLCNDCSQGDCTSNVSQPLRHLLKPASTSAEFLIGYLHIFKSGMYGRVHTESLLESLHRPFHGYAGAIQHTELGSCIPTFQNQRESLALAMASLA